MFEVTTVGPQRRVYQLAAVDEDDAKQKVRDLEAPLPDKKRVIRATEVPR